MRQEGKSARKSLLQFHVRTVVTGGPVSSGRAYRAAPQREGPPAQYRGRTRRVRVQSRLVALAVIHLMDAVRSHVTQFQQDIRKQLPLDAEAINQALDRLAEFVDEVRLVIVP